VASRKIAISLPASLAGKIERERKRTGETRSALVRRAVERWFAEREERARIAAYVEGYRTHPESEEEIAAAEAGAVSLLGGEPWE